MYAWHGQIIRSFWQCTSQLDNKIFELIGIKNTIISFTNKAMSYWKTNMCLHTEGKITETEDLEIQCGIFQGDSIITTAILH